jgi:hypothetical protein
MKTIAQRVTTFAANLGALEDERKALSLDILAEVGKRKGLDASCFCTYLIWVTLPKSRGDFGRPFSFLKENQPCTQSE